MEKNIGLIALFAALIAALGLIPKFTLAFGVPITAQSLGIMLCGTILGSRKGFAAVALFVALTLLGLPLLAGGRGGLGLLASPSVGFILAFPIAAYVTGRIVELWRSTAIGIVATVASFIGGVLVLYFFGILGMAYILDKSILAAATLTLAFIPGDIIKCILAGLITKLVFKARPESVLARAG